MAIGKKKRRLMFRRKRTLDPSIVIDYKKPDVLKRFITDRGKIIPRRISGATSTQQRDITMAVKRARYLALLPFSVTHRQERGFSGELMAAMSAPVASPGGYYRGDRGEGRGRGEGGGFERRDRGEGRGEGGFERGGEGRGPRGDAGNEGE